MATPLLVITGAAGAGKTTAGRAIAQAEPRVLSIDGDVLAAGSSAILRRDFIGFWAYAISIAVEVAANSLTPLISCVCRPEQILVNDLRGFSYVSMLAMTCDAEVRIDRAESRAESIEWRTAVEEHNAIDRALRGYQMPPPHRYAILDTTAIDEASSTRLARDWVRDELAAASPP
jgi:hypothetical protein